MKGRGIITIIVFITLVIGTALIIGSYTNTSTKKYEYNDFVDKVKKDEVISIKFVNNYLVKFKDASGGYSVGIPYRTVCWDEIKPYLEENNKLNIVSFNDPSAMGVADYIFPIIMFLLVIVMLVFFFRQVGKQNNQGIQFSKSRTRINDNIKVRFSDVAGADEEKEELAEVVEFLKNPKIYHELGARVPRGILLVGPPGTGKTLLAKAVAGEAGVPFFSISGSDFVELYVGVGAARVRDLFEQAKRNMPSIVFIDEIDAVGRQRGAGLGGGHDEREQTLNQLLVQMDGFETTTGIIIIAATNRADILDPALLRPGRFDRQVTVHLPDVRGREEILKVHARNKPLGSDVDFKIVARITAGFTGADLENLLNEAAILAVRDSRRQISMIDMNEAINKVTMGPAKKSLLITESDKRITAYHEAGHAIVSRILNRKVHEVTIIPRGQTGGFTSFRPENDNQMISKQELLDSIATLLGGRVAEELILENVTVGASGDIRHISSLAHKMVAELGFSDKVGPVYYGSEGEVFVGKHYQTQMNYSDETSALIDKEASKIICEQHERAKEILGERLELLHNFARVLLEVETINGDEVDRLVGGTPPEDVVRTVSRRAEDNKRTRDSLRESQNRQLSTNPIISKITHATITSSVK